VTNSTASGKQEPHARCRSDTCPVTPAPRAARAHAVVRAALEHASFIATALLA
jgi:hypothetical protein